MDKRQCLMLIANKLISINALNVSELCCIYFRGQEAGPQHAVFDSLQKYTYALPFSEFLPLLYNRFYLNLL